MKENDYLLNLIANPTFNPSDFKEVGLTTDNTSIEKKDVYKNLQAIQDNPEFQTDGKFDEVKFNQIYDYALQQYNQLAQEETGDKIVEEISYYKNNIFADNRITQPEYSIYKEANPTKRSSGTVYHNNIQESDKSIREIAQTQKVWDNVTQSWQDAPNDSFFKNFWETRVLAQWDEDGEHIDPFSGQTVKHTKGQKKINENGTFYYENLNGRDVYGRDVLSKFDTLTVDGSFVNKFDFFDSDDKKKTLGDNLVKNAIKVVPALISGIAPWYVGIRVAINTTEMLSKLGKIIAGKDNPTLSAIEGFTASLATSSSDYAQGSEEVGMQAHAWSIENILNMGADTMLQLAEQRWIFKYVPSLFKGKAGYNKEAQAKFLETQATKDNIAENIKGIAQRGAFKDKAKAIAESEAVSAMYTQQALSKYMESYNNIGKYVSQAYMTALTAQDTYREAIEEGASGLEAALLTLGYAAGEYAIINSDLGRWILPELKQQKMQFKQIGKLLPTLPKGNASSGEKITWIKKVLKLGSDIADNTYNHWGTNFAKNTLAGALSEGFEETSEELWADMIKSLANGVQSMFGSDTRYKTFENVGDRYGLSFVGGLLGGAIGSFQTDFKAAKENQIKDRDQAWQELIHIVKEGKTNEFLKTIDKMTWASGSLSAQEGVNINGVPQYMPGTSTDNHNESIRKAIHEQVRLIESIINANGAAIDDESILGALVNSDKDFRFLALKQSTFAANYLQDFNTLTTKIVDVSMKLNDLQNPKVKDSEKKEALERNKEQINEAKAELKSLLEQKEYFLSEDNRNGYILKALFEMNEDISSAFIDTNKITWIENQEGKKIKEIAPERLKILEKQWEAYSEFERKDKLEQAYRIFEKGNPIASKLIKEHKSKYLDIPENSIINTFNRLTEGKFAAWSALEDNENYTKLIGSGRGNSFNFQNSTTTLLAVSLINSIKDPGLHNSFDQQFAAINNLEDPSEQENEVLELLNKLFSTDSVADSFIQEIEHLPFISRVDKSQIIKLLDGIITEFQRNPLNNSSIHNLRQLVSKIRKKQDSPVIELIDQWSLSLKNSDTTTSKLINILNQDYIIKDSNNNLEEFSIELDNAERLKVALNNIKLLKTYILAARTDSVSLSSIIGYNATANELTKSDLAEIDKNTAYVLLQDVSKIEAQLQFFAKLHEVNTGQKLLDHKKAKVNRDIIIYNKIHRLSSEHNWPPEDWKGANELKTLLNSGLNIVHTLQKDDVRTLSLDKKDSVFLQKDMQAIDNALYNFFQQNQDKLNDPKELAKLLSEDLFTFFSDTTATLTKDTQEIDDKHFVWYLATRAALNPEAFYKTYKQNFINGIAPISSQEQAIMTAVAATLNNEIFSNFAKAYNISLQNSVKGWKSEDFQYFQEDKPHRMFWSAIDSDSDIQFFRHLLVEGVAGSGKSTAVAKTIVQLLNNSDKGKELLKNVWFVHSSENQAKNLAKELGFGDNYENAMSFETYLTKISSNKISGYRKIENDELKLDISNLAQDTNGYYKYNIEINKGYTSNAPSLIIMDEVTKVSQQDLLLSDQFNEYYGINTIALGDFDQDGLEGKVVSYETDSDGRIVEKPYTTSDGGEVVTNLYSGNFISPFKLGDSLRTGNAIKDKNNKQVRTGILELKRNPKSDISIGLDWYTDGTEENDYKDSTVLYGDKLYKNDSDFEDIKRDINILLNNLPEGEKLGYIYNNKDSKLYTYLTDLNKSGEFKNRIDIREGSTSQGMEGDYYVVDLWYKSGWSDVQKSRFWRKVYTGLTRAKKGTVSIINTDEQDIFYQKDQSESAGEFSLSKESISKFALELKEVYDQVYEGDPVSLPFVPYKNKKTDSTITIKDVVYKVITKPDELKSNIGDTVTFEAITYTIKGFLQDDSGQQFVWAYSDQDNLFTIDIFKSMEKKIFPTEKKLSDEIKRTRRSLTKDNTDKIDIINNDDNELNMLLHSFASNETGTVIRGNKYYLGPGHPDRIDGLNGLAKLIPGTTKADGEVINQDLFTVYDKIRSAALYAKSNSEIIKVLEDEGIKNCNIKLAFKNTNMPEKYGESLKNPKPKKFWKSIKEHIRGIFLKDRQLVPNDKHIVLIVTQKDGANNKQVLEIPLVQFTNPITLLGTKGFEAIKSRYDSITGYKKGSVDHLKALKDSIEDSDKMGKAFKKLLDLYLIHNDTIVLLEDKPLSSIFTGLGLTISNVHRGDGYEVEGYEYEGEWLPLFEYLKQSGKSISNVIAPKEDIKDFSGKVVIPAGKLCVFATDAVHKYSSATSDETFIKDYIKQIQNPDSEKLLKAIFVSPPTVSIEEYFKNMNSVYKKSDDIDYTIGVETTSLTVLSAILEDNLFFDSLPSSGDFRKVYNTLKTVCEKFKALKDNQEDIVTLLNSKNDIDDIKLINLDPRATSWKQYLQKQLRYYTLSYFDSGKIKYIETSKIGDESSKEGKLIQSRINDIKKSLLERGIDGIFYRPPYLDDSIEIHSFKALTKNHDFTYKGAPYMINGKLDGQSFKGNVLPLIDYIIKATTVVHKSGYTQAEKDYLTYINDNWVSKKSAEKELKDQIKQLVKQYKIKNSEKKELEDIMFNIAKENSDVDTANSKIIEYLNTNYYKIKDPSLGTVVLRKLDKGEKQEGQYLIDAEGNKHKYIRFDSKLGVIMERVVEPTDVKENSLTEQDIIDFFKIEQNVSKLNDVITQRDLTFPTLEQNKIPDQDYFEQLVFALNALEKEFPTSEDENLKPILEWLSDQMKKCTETSG